MRKANIVAMFGCKFSFAKATYVHLSIILNDKKYADSCWASEANGVF
jgi:hypothetical protein